MDWLYLLALTTAFPKVSIYNITRATDPAGFYPDPSFDKKLDPDQTYEKKHIQIWPLYNNLDPDITYFFTLRKFTFYFFSQHKCQYPDKVSIYDITRATDPAGFYPDPSFEKKTGSVSDLRRKKTSRSDPCITIWIRILPFFGPKYSHFTFSRNIDVNIIDILILYYNFS